MWTSGERAPELESEHSPLQAPRSADNKKEFSDPCRSSSRSDFRVRLLTVTLAWMVVECGVSLAGAVTAHRPNKAGALNNGLESGHYCLRSEEDAKR